MYNNMYGFNSVPSVDRIDAQINELKKIKEQMQKPVQPPTSLTQNFQLAPSTRETLKYADSIDEVQNDIVGGDMPYFSKDMSVLWLKNSKGIIKTYELNEIVPKDEKDLQIEFLQAQIDELKRGINNYEQCDTNVISEEDSTNTSRDDKSVGATTEKSKSSSIQRVSTSKKK